MATKGKTFIVALICALVFAACDNDDSNTISGPIYGDNNENDTIVGPTYDHDATAVEACVYFYGNVMKGNGTYNLLLSTQETDELNNSVPNSTNYVVYFVGEPVGDDEAPELTEGTYKYTNDSTVLSIVDFGLHGSDAQADGRETYYYFDDATLTIAQTGDGNYKIEFCATDTDGETHHMVFNGKPRLLDERGYTNEPTTTMTANTTLDMSRAEAYGEYYKGTAVNDNSQWRLVWSWDDEQYNGTYYLHLVVVNDAAGFAEDGFCGTYTADSTRYPFHTATAGTFAVGVIYGGYNNGAYYQYYGEYPKVRPRAYFQDGTINITPTDDEGIFNLKFDLIEENGYHVTGEWTGPIETYNYEGYF